MFGEPDPLLESFSTFHERLFARLLDVVPGGVLGMYLAAITGVPPVVGVSAVLLGYHTVLEGLWGRTPGKYLIGDVVVTDDGEVPGLGRAVVRNVSVVFATVVVIVHVALVLWSVLFGLLIYLSIDTSERNRRLADRLVGTVVVENEGPP